MNKTSKAIAICLTLLSICLPLLPLFAQPDLIVDKARLLQDLRTDLLDNNDPCYINEGCVGGLGDRQLIRFTTHIKNIGTTDFVVGTPPADPTLENDTWEYDQCHQHWHYEGYAQYLLFDQAGNEIPVGLKNGFCLMDSECSGGGNLQYHCGYQGISAGCGDIYGWGLDCQWVDVTDIPSGIYRLVNRVNWTRDLDVNGQAESNYENNSASVCLQLSRSANGTHLFQVLDDAQCNCSDNDADGICAAEDCDDNNSAVPSTPGANCDDGDAATSNDVMLADGCTCQGTPDNTGGNQTVVDCNGITLTYGDGQIQMAGTPNNTYYFKIHDLNNAWQEVYSCALNCSSTQTTPLAAGFYKVKVYNASWTPICDIDINPTGNTGTCADIDGDGICAASDCDDSDPSIPAAPGTSCDDGNSNTSTDLIQADGCTCLGQVVTGCVDVDGDGVCAIADCDDTDANIPTSPGTNCDDGNPNTSTDLIQADGCTCLGTTTNTGNSTVLACNDITITYGNGQIDMTGSAGTTYYFKIHDLNNAWQEVFSCAINCSSSQITTLPPSFYKIKVYSAAWVPICDTDITLTSGTSTCIDIDGDGVCADVDCDDTDAAVPAIPGITCDDNNANTSTDVIQADGCTCLGVITTGCTDIDSDGICADVDCDDTNASVPTAPGTACDDNDANTSTDVIQADGCTCLGVITTGCTDIDGDGVCSIADCDDTNASVPTTPGTTCNDNNAATNNDQIQADGCTCLGTNTASNTGTCSDIMVTTTPNTIIINGLTVPIEIIKIYNVSGGWQQVFNCVANCGSQQTVDNLPPGNYIVEVQFYSASWNFICSEQIDAIVASAVTEEADASFFRKSATSSLPTKAATLNLFPNPAKETVSLNLSNWKKEKLEVTIYNHLAQEVLQTQVLNSKASVHQLAIATLPNGLYILKVSDGEQVLSKKLFITR